MRSTLTGGAPVSRPFSLIPLLCLLAIVTVNAQPRPARIISIVPAATEILFAIGAGPRVVAVSSYDREPAEVSALPRVGALVDPNVERIFALGPDLVVVYDTQHDLKTQLDRAGIRWTPFVHGGLKEVTAAVRALGAATGETAGAERVAAGIERTLAGVAARVAGRPRPRTLLVFGREPGTLRNLYASGGVGFLHDMLDTAGGENVFADQARQNVQVTAEMLLALRPEVVIELHAAGEALDLSPWNRLPALPAVRDKRVVALSGSDLVVPGPRVATATERLARALHPVAF